MRIELLFIQDLSFVFYFTHILNLVSYLSSIFSSWLIMIYFYLSQTYKYLLYQDVKNILFFNKNYVSILAFCFSLNFSELINKIILMAS